MAVERLAPAKLNLFLHVGPLGPDGYHPLVSLVTFADVGDVVAIENADRMGFAVDGPFASDLGAGADNLVVKARELLADVHRPAWSPFRLTLRKTLPIASGLGGGSSDAAAAMRLMATRSALASNAADERLLFEIAGRLGADVPMCLVGEPRVVEGRGDRLSLPPPFPPLDVVLVNPRAPSPTGAVYRAYDEAGAPGGADTPAWPDALETPQDVATFLFATRNDLEAPAVGLEPRIGEVLAALRAQPETLIARMSGSGATCFAICANERRRSDLALAIGDAHPDWWVQPCRLAGFCP